MRIGIVSTWMERGAAYVSRQYCSVLAREHEVYIYARGGEERAAGNPDWDNDRVTWGASPRAMVPTMVDMDDFARWASTVKPDVVLFNEQNWWTPVVWCNSKKIVTGAYIDYYTRETVDLFGCYDFLICNTKRHHSVFSWHPGCHYVPWGTDTTVFAPRALDRISGDHVVFFHSAGYSPYRKGTDLAIRAFQQIEGEAQLVVHTQRPLSELPCMYSPLVRRLIGAGKLLVLCATVRAPGLYHRGDVYVYPSRLDGVGLTVPEALACGLPVITIDNPPMNEFVDRRCGSLVSVSRIAPRSDGYYWPQCEVSTHDLASAMQAYVDSPDELPQRKMAARHHATANLDWTTNSVDVGDIFVAALKAGPIPKGQRESRALAYDDRTTGLALRSPAAYNVKRVFRGVTNRIWDRLLRRWTAVNHGQ